MQRMKTDRTDYADKRWLDDGPDQFQLLSADACVFILCCVAFIGFVMRGYL